MFSLKRGIFLFSILLIFFSSLNLVYACSLPTNGLQLNSSLTLCSGTYLLNDTGEGILQGSVNNSQLNCGGAILKGNGSGTGLGLTGGNVLVFGCAFDNYAFGADISNTTGVVLINSTFGNMTLSSIVAADTNNLTLANITIINNSNNLISSIIVGAIDLTRVSYSVITNSSLRTFNDYGVRVVGGLRNNLTNNFLEQGYNGTMILIHGTNDTILQGNYINNMSLNLSDTGNKTYGVTIYDSFNTLIKDNIITNITSTGLLISNCSFAQVINNTIIFTSPIPGTTGSGSDILDQYNFNITLANNTLRGLGIQTAASNFSDISGNNFSGIAGLFIGGAYGFNIANNAFYNSSLEINGLTLANFGAANLIEHNIFFNTSLKRFGVDESKRSIYVSNVYSPLIIRHNIINFTQKSPAASVVPIGTAGIGYLVGMQLDDAANIVVENNTFFDMGDYAIITGSPTGGTGVYNISFLNNTIVRGRIGVLASALNSTTFVGNIITNTTAAGILFRLNAVGNTLINNSFSGNPIDAGAIHSTSSNTILNSSGVTTNSSGGILYVQWFGIANISFSNGTSGNGINATFANQSSVLRSSALAGSNNLTALTVLTQYYESSGAKVYEAPLTVNASRGASTAQTTFNITGSGQVVSLVLNALPSAPSLSSPSDGVTDPATTVNFTWSNSTDVDVQPISYIFELSTSNTFAALVDFSVISETATTSKTVAGLTDGATYYWRVRATDGFSNSSTSSRSFTVGTATPPPPDSCFPAGTKILMADRSEKNIEDVRVGDKVIGYNGNEQVEEAVLVLESPIRDHLYRLTFADGSQVELTREHPLYTQDSWKALSPKETKEENPNLIVGNLRVGDKVLTADNVYVRLARIDYIPGRVQTYNLKSVSENNNFFANNFLAHNKGGGGGCEDECELSDTPVCDNDDVLECGDFDSDTCLEWRTVACGVGMTCDDGACVCEEHVVCGQWSACTNGMQERTCEDTNACRVGPFTEERSCGSGLQIPGLLEEEGRSGFMQCLVTQGLSSREILNLEFLMKIDGCAPGYGVVDVERACGGYNVDVSGEALLSLLLDGPKPGVFVSFEPRDLGGPYCPYCFDGVQDFDEISVDCGGPSCPSCTEKPAFLVRPPVSIPLAMIIALVLSLVGIYFSGKYMKKVL